MVEGFCKSWDDDAGWGVLTSPDVPGELFAHFSSIDAVGFKSLSPGEHVRFDWESYPPGQDGYFYRATRVQQAGLASG
jgi:cold shock protein